VKDNIYVGIVFGSVYTTAVLKRRSVVNIGWTLIMTSCAVVNYGEAVVKYTWMFGWTTVQYERVVFKLKVARDFFPLGFFSAMPDLAPGLRLRQF
jgi:hypothetical protein